MSQDHVDRIIAQWQRERPDLDTLPMAIIGRISRLSLLTGRQIEQTFKGFGLTREGYDVLATLRRSGPPYRMNPTQLFQGLMISSGTLTNRLDRLEEAELIQRLPDPGDRRGTLVELTARGKELVESAGTADMAARRPVVDLLSNEERDQLAGLLRKLLLHLETNE